MEFSVFLIKNWSFFRVPFLGNIARNEKRDRSVFTSADCIFEHLYFGFPKRRLQKKVCRKFEDFHKSQLIKYWNLKFELHCIVTTQHEFSPWIHGKNFPAYTPTLWRMKDHEFFFGAKWDDFWPIEELWAVLSHSVYRNPRPKSIGAVMRRVAKAVRETDPNLLTIMIHQMPAKINEIYSLKGKRIPPNFEPSKSAFACKCKICTSWVSLPSVISQPQPNCLEPSGVY